MAAAVWVLAAGPSWGSDELTPVAGRVLTEPRVAVLSNGTFCVNYELFIEDATGTGVTIEKVEIVDPSRADAPVASLKKDEIAKYLHLPGASEPTTKLSAARAGHMKINLSFDAGDRIPSELEHVVTVTMDKPVAMISSNPIVRMGRSRVVRDRPITIAPPVKGPGWIAVGVGGYYYHRLAVLPVNGRWVNPERWAVDWIQVDGKNRFFVGDKTKNESYPQYGKEILAVADGVIESARDGLPDEPAGKAPEGMTLDRAAGNYIVQDIGAGSYALYAHLKPGSLRIKKGDMVRRGQTIALLGNSGNSDGPHLHFHIINGTEPLGSDGLPYAIDSFTLTGEAVSQDCLATEFSDSKPVTVNAAAGEGRRSGEMPANLAVVDF